MACAVTTRTANETNDFLRTEFGEPFWWCQLAGSELRFDTVGLLFVEYRQISMLCRQCTNDWNTLKLNIRRAIRETELETINNWADNMLYCKASRGLTTWTKLYFINYYLRPVLYHCVKLHLITWKKLICVRFIAFFLKQYH